MRRWPAAVALAALFLLSIGVLGRGFWKPDEPREAALAARMARPGASLAVPTFGGRPFCEKPPLYYWVSAGSIRLFGASPVGARLPNILWGVAAALAAAALARPAAGPVGALAAGLAMTSFYLSWRVGSWVATDALLATAVAGALWTLLRGLEARRGAPKLAWYAAMHLCLATGFLTKNVVAWIVPGFALLAVVLWEKRWRELLAWELWAGWLVQAAAVLPWVAAVAARPDAAKLLRIFFVNNLLGRFTPMEGVGYTTSHKGWAGKYLVELPAYLAPWTLLMVAAVAAGWLVLRGRDDDSSPAERTAWRFAFGAVVPPLLLLSASTSKRDIYAILLMPGFALTAGLWCARVARHETPLDRRMARWTFLLLGLAVLLLPPAVAVAAHRFAPDLPLTHHLLAAVAWIAGIALAVTGLRKPADEPPLPRLGRSFLLALLVPAAVAPLAFPVVDRAQDLRPVALAAAEAATAHPLAIWNGDETILGVLDFNVGLEPPMLSTEAALRERLAATPDLRLLAEVTRGKKRGEGIESLISTFDLRIARRIDLPEPGGRSYLILEPLGR